MWDLRFPWLYFVGFRSSGMWCCVAGLVVSYVVKDCTAFVFRRSPGDCSGMSAHPTAWTRKVPPLCLLCVVLAVIHLCIQLVVVACQYKYSKSLQFPGFMFSKSPVGGEKISSEVQTLWKEWGCRNVSHTKHGSTWLLIYDCENICVDFYQNDVDVLGWKLSVVQKCKSVW
jgi:hypothetical protein